MHLVPLSTLLVSMGSGDPKQRCEQSVRGAKTAYIWPSLAMRLLVAGASNAAAEVLEPGAAPVVPLPGGYPCAAQPAPAPPAAPASPIREAKV